MRTITLIIIHCSAVKPDQMSSAAQIDTWHRQRGFHLGIGYHYVVRRNGEIEPGRPEYMVGAHCLNHNAHSIGVCYEGHAHRGTEGIAPHVTRKPSLALPPRRDRRPSRPEPPQGVPLHRERRPRIRRPAAEMKYKSSTANWQGGFFTFSSFVSFFCATFAHEVNIYSCTIRFGKIFSLVCYMP